MKSEFFTIVGLTLLGDTTRTHLTWTVNHWGNLHKTMIDDISLEDGDNGNIEIIEINCIMFSVYDKRDR